MVESEPNILMQNWEDDYLIETAIESPRVWNTLYDEIEIQELKSDRFDEVLKMIEDHYIYDEPLIQSSLMHTDNGSVKEYLYLVQTWMKDTLSTVAVEQKTGNVVGFLICRFNEIHNRDPEFSNHRVYEGTILRELQNFKHYLTKRGNAYKHNNVDKMLEVYSWFVLPQFRSKGIGTELLKNVIERQLPEYKWFDIKVIAGVFTDKVSQRIATSLGMETLYEFVYSAWTPINKTTGEQKEFFKEIVRENYSAKVMCVNVGQSSSSSVHSGHRSNNIDEHDITL
ncbi:PREDICTED: uncharacterized protein LOC107168939 [Diuraphis noxia]|uniref:uncharacterized protein LOC107168939 n=1 Tax=Diuraphis noxia TaxID=143948 RepID=UPI0007638311|nr:PREDICTED: uncharacterized protein LOC107168939 [Diuraphis noxia]